MTKLYKSTTDKVIDGVCGGIAEYFDIDSVIVRALFVLITLVGGSGILLYIVLAIIMPEQGTKSKNTNEVVAENAKNIEKKVTETVEKVEEKIGKKHSVSTFGVVLIFLGIYFLLQTSHFPMFSIIRNLLENLWPVALIIIGFVVIAKKGSK